ncbi:F-box/WD repeat-containing protein 5-like [Haliotis rufescens]|uniref:F-box/WD repeat-containing protein 5-like n=1 Tax=Haliotis rufescens TaxID=6454 RepID=UPI001EB01A11|nr:F-box/WD repeat-containing protein 5-like [Haliotis rufescens]XP_046377979.1 F-box/WD repeat-containing protein 5-like [Haliotis rufescens]
METDAPSDDGESEIPMRLCSMASIPDSLLLSIFSNLVAKDVLKASQVCSRWRAVAYDESLWRQLVYRKWNISGKIAPGYCSWRNEYKRLYYYAPLVWSETLTEHSDEVLHVSFAHNGSLFATTSKDCSVKVWQVGYPTRLKYSYDFRAGYKWDFTQFSCFNEADTMLLVSSVKSTEMDRRGFVAVLSVQHNFQLLRVVSMDPSQLFGTWLNGCTFLGGSLEISLDRFATTVQIQAFEVKDVPQLLPASASVETHSGLALFTFCSETASLIKFLTVVNVPCKGISPIQETELENIDESGCSVINHEHDECTKEDVYPSVATSSGNSSKGEQFCSNIVIQENGHPLHMDYLDDSEMEEEPEEKYVTKRNTNTHPKRTVTSMHHLKLRNLIYVTGEFAVALHQLGFKDISPNTISDIVVERTMESVVTDLDSIQSHMVVNYSNQDIEMRRIRKPDMSDHMIDLNGHVTGLCLSQDNRYLFVNCRPWVGKIDRSDPWATPELSPEIEVRVIDLQDLSDTGVRYRGHKGYSQSTMCCFVFLDSSEHYIGSGSEDTQAYLWDRHYQCCLGVFGHGPGVVNSVGFSPRDEEYFVTVSDDHTIKIWRSRNRLKQVIENAQSLDR